MTTLNNQDVRLHAKTSKVALWQIAKRMGVCEMTVTRMLRDELPQERKVELLALIDRIAAEEGRA